MRARTCTAAALALVAAVSLAGCSSDDGSTPKDASGGTSAGSEPAQPYAAELTEADQPTPSDAPDGFLLLQLTNTGTRADRYVVQVLPPEAGQVSPGVVELRPGTSAVLTVRADATEAAPSGAPDRQPQLVVHSTTTNRDAATYDLD